MNADAPVWIDSVEDADLCGFTTPGYYFWDETQSQCYGPYETWIGCYNQACNYVEMLMAGRNYKETNDAKETV